MLKKTIIIISVFLFSGLSIKGNELSFDGFYSSPGEIIKKYDNENAGYKEHFLLGIAYKKNNDNKTAIFHFANSCFKYSVKTDLVLYANPVYKYVNAFHVKSGYYDDSVYEISRLFYSYKEFEYVIKFINLIGKTNFPLYKDAIILKSNALMELGKYKEAIKLLEGLISDFTDIDSRSTAYVRMASAYEKQNQYQDAVNIYLKIIELDAKSWQSGIACGRIKEITANYTYQFAARDEFNYAVALYRNSKIEAIDILKSLLEKQNDLSRETVLKYLIKACVKFNNLKDANGLISKYKDNPEQYFKLLKTKADELWSSNKNSAYNDYFKLYENSTGEILRESHEKICRIMITRNAAYRDITLKYIMNYPTDSSSEYFLWTLAKNDLNGDIKSAIKYLEELLPAFPQGQYSARSRAIN